MKKSILSLLLFFVVLFGFTANAQAKDMTRRFGLGVDSTISKYATEHGLSVNAFICGLIYKEIGDMKPKQTPENPEET